MDHLPAVPKHFVQQSISIAENWQENLVDHPVLNSTLEPSINPRLIVNNNGDYETLRWIPRFQLDNEWEQWVGENISDKFTDTGVASSVVVPSDAYKDSGLSSIHSDKNRKFALFYTIKQGNADQWTRWYHQSGQPLRRPLAITLTGQQGIEKIDQAYMPLVEKIDQAYMPLNSWVYCETGILHQTGNHQGERIAIHVSFNEDVFGLFEHNNQP